MGKQLNFTELLNAFSKQEIKIELSEFIRQHFAHNIVNPTL